jgi:hypothetical protein
MNDILKTLKMIDLIESNKPLRKKLKESAVAECGDMGAMSAPAPQNPGNPVTASITLNASGMDNVADLMKLIQNAGLQPQGPAPAPTLPMRTDMEQLRDKMAGLEAPVSAPKPQYFDTDDVTGGGDDIHKKKNPADIRIKDGSLADSIKDSNIEEWENEPEEEYGDHLDMIKRLSGGINREKKMYKPAAKGDNPMTVEGPKAPTEGEYYDDERDISIRWTADDDGINIEAYDAEENMVRLSPRDEEHYMELIQQEMQDNQDDYGDWKYRQSIGDNVQYESIKSRLYNALNEKKAKPDFLDVDKDGNKKEPMKKALKDKKKKPNFMKK